MEISNHRPPTVGADIHRGYPTIRDNPQNLFLEQVWTATTRSTSGNGGPEAEGDHPVEPTAASNQPLSFETVTDHGPQVSRRSLARPPQPAGATGEPWSRLRSTDDAWPRPAGPGLDFARPTMPGHGRRALVSTSLDRRCLATAGGPWVSTSLDRRAPGSRPAGLGLDFARPTRTGGSRPAGLGLDFARPTRWLVSAGGPGLDFARPTSTGGLDRRTLVSTSLDRRTWLAGRPWSRLRSTGGPWPRPADRGLDFARPANARPVNVGGWQIVDTAMICSSPR